MESIMGMFGLFFILFVVYGIPLIFAALVIRNILRPIRIEVVEKKRKEGDDVR